MQGDVALHRTGSGCNGFVGVETAYIQGLTERRCGGCIHPGTYGASVWRLHTSRDLRSVGVEAAYIQGLTERRCGGCIHAGTYGALVWRLHTCRDLRSVGVEAAYMQGLTERRCGGCNTHTGLALALCGVGSAFTEHWCGGCVHVGRHGTYTGLEWLCVWRLHTSRGHGTMQD